MVSTRDLGGGATSAHCSRGRLSSGATSSRKPPVPATTARATSQPDAPIEAGYRTSRFEPAHLPLAAVVPTFTSFGASAAFAEQVRLVHKALGDGKLVGHGEGTRGLRGSVGAEVVLGALLAAGQPS